MERLALRADERRGPGHRARPQAEIELSLADRFIISRLQQTETQVTKALEEFRFDHASQALYDFVWNEYCDWYLELSKPVLWDEAASEAAKRGTRRTLVRVLEAILRLAHPMMPYISEEIWQRVAPLAGIDTAASPSIMTQPWPEAEQAKLDEQATRDIEWLKGVIVAVRNIRAEMNIAPGKALEVLLTKGEAGDRERLEANRRFLAKLAKLESVTWLDDPAAAPLCATQLVGEMEVLVPMADLIDKDVELARLGKEIEKQDKLITGTEKKLGNESFTAKAPEAVVQKERDKLADFKAARALLAEQRDKIAAL